MEDVTGYIKRNTHFQHQDDNLFYRYEIIKNEHRGGYFAIIYLSDNRIHQGSKIPSWEITIPFMQLKSNYLPNARVECELHFNETHKIAVLQ
ncbi:MULTISPECIES: hypothetical protein [Symbiopectobacterium]|uniref:hypothetical protein n=1 Tax=Symbiopectobacterium TaxID=801 RepID=UPI001A2FF7BC|nr:MULTISPECIES: hypothetical protein [Symbiopectobacterium]MBG6248463.1 hypothetical protein [Candidatus Symbiopectobacterium sp. PLON1]MBT9428857.1 hypothetical protein [Candidatus Symbiopectobacterium endolongispinus]